MKKIKIKFELKPVLYFMLGLILGIALVFPYEKSSAKIDNKLIKLSYQEYKELKNKDLTSVIVIGRDSCGWCQKFIPIISEVKTEKNINIYYLNTDTLSNDEKDDLNKSDSLFTSDEFGTPTLILVKNDKIINYNIGYLEKSNIINWLEEVGLLNEK